MDLAKDNAGRIVLDRRGLSLRLGVVHREVRQKATEGYGFGPIRERITYCRFQIVLLRFRPRVAVSDIRRGVG
jgi:hypothetical protein